VAAGDTIEQEPTTIEICGEPSAVPWCQGEGSIPQFKFEAFVKRKNKESTCFYVIRLDDFKTKSINEGLDKSTDEATWIAQHHYDVTLLNNRRRVKMDLTKQKSSKNRPKSGHYSDKLDGTAKGASFLQGRNDWESHVIVGHGEKTTILITLTMRLYLRIVRRFFWIRSRNWKNDWFKIRYQPM
jgi:hypothetical protein